MNPSKAKGRKRAAKPAEKTSEEEPQPLNPDELLQEAETAAPDDLEEPSEAVQIDTLSKGRGKKRAKQQPLAADAEEKKTKGKAKKKIEQTEGKEEIEEVEAVTEKKKTKGKAKKEIEQAVGKEEIEEVEAATETAVENPAKSRGRPRKQPDAEIRQKGEKESADAAPKKPAAKNKGKKQPTEEVPIDETSSGAEEKVKPPTRNRGGKRQAAEKTEEKVVATKKQPKGKKTVDIENQEPANNSEEKAVAKKQPKAKATQSDPGPSASNSASKPPNRSVLQLKITLLDITPPIWRRIQVLNNITFYQLHEDIKEAMGWIAPHGQQFHARNPKTDTTIYIRNANDEFAADIPNSLKEQTTKLSKFLNAAGDKVFYEFSWSDSWMHEVVVEKVLPPPPPKAEYPKCLAGKRACPVEDCGAAEGYMHLVEVYNNPNHEEYDELINDWLAEFNPGFDPEKFDKKMVYRRGWVWSK